MKIKIDLAKMVSDTPSATESFTIDHLTYKGNVSESLQGFIALDVIRTTSSLTVTVAVGGQTLTFTGSEALTLSATGDYIVVDGEWTMYVPTTYKSLLDLGYISFDAEGKTALVVYRQNDENDAVSKLLTEVRVIQGKFSKAIGVKTMEFEIEGYQRDWNYVWIPTLRRYYYVDQVTLLTAGLSGIRLKEDVLMSWASLIKRQYAYIERSESDYDDDLPDERCAHTYDKTITATAVTMTNNVFGSVSNTDKDFVIETVGGNS